MLLVRAVHHDLLRRVAARSNQGSNNGGKEYNSPGAEPLWGRRMTAGRRKAPTMSQELQCSRPTFDSERPRVWKWGRQTSNVPRAPTNLVTSLTVIQYSFTLSMHLTWGVAQLHIYVGHNSWANWARLMHFCHIAANCLLTQTSVAFYTLHYGSISRGVMKGQWGRNYLGAESLWGRWMITGAPKNPNNFTHTFFNTVHLLPEDLRFENGGAKLASCPGRYLTSLRPCQSGDQFRQEIHPLTFVLQNDDADNCGLTNCNGNSPETVFFDFILEACKLLSQ